MVFFPFETSGSWLARLYLYYICFCLSSVAKTTRIVCPILHPLYRMTLRAHDHGAYVELEVCRASDRAFSPQPLHTKEIFDQRHCTPRAIYKRLRQESFRQSAATRAATPWAFSTQEVSARRLCAKRGSGLRNKTMQTRAALDCKAEQDHASKQQWVATRKPVRPRFTKTLCRPAPPWIAPDAHEMLKWLCGIENLQCSRGNKSTVANDVKKCKLWNHLT